MKTLFIAPEEWSNKLHVLEASPDEYARKFQKSSGISSLKAFFIGLSLLITSCCVLYFSNVNIILKLALVLVSGAFILILDGAHMREKGNRSDLIRYRENNMNKDVIVRNSNPVWSKAKTVEKLSSKISRKRIKLQESNNLADNSIGITEIEQASLAVLDIMREPENEQYKLNYKQSLLELKEVYKKL